MVRDDRLSGVFRQTGGSGRDTLNGDNAGLDFLEAESEFMKNFKTPMVGANGAGPILNANANLLPTLADQYRETANSNDYRLGDGLGIARPYRRNDSMGGATRDGFYGFTKPTKMFGRDSKTPDLNYQRDDMISRADVTLKKMGDRPNEVPQFAAYQPWDWNNTYLTGRGGAAIGNQNQYNRNYPVPDADQAARRSYNPAPSRKTKMLATDVETAALRPNRTLLHPLKVVTEDRQRQKLQRPSRNTDVIESVVYDNIMPRGMGSSHGTPKVWSDPDVLRQPVATNDTGSRAVNGIWKNGFSDPLQYVTNEDKLIAAKNTMVQVRGHRSVAQDEAEFAASEEALQRQRVPDYNHIQPQRGEFPHNQQGLNVPLLPFKGVGRSI